MNPELLITGVLRLTKGQPNAPQLSSPSRFNITKRPLKMSNEIIDITINFGDGDHQNVQWTELSPQTRLELIHIAAPYVADKKLPRYSVQRAIEKKILVRKASYADWSPGNCTKCMKMGPSLSLCSCNEYKNTVYTFMPRKVKDPWLKWNPKFLATFCQAEENPTTLFGTCKSNPNLTSPLPQLRPGQDDWFDRHIHVRTEPTRTVLSLLFNEQWDEIKGTLLQHLDQLADRSVLE